MKKYKTISEDRNGDMSINGSFGFEGTLGELEKLIKKTIKEVGKNTKCSIEPFGSFPNRWDAYITVEIKKDK